MIVLLTKKDAFSMQAIKLAKVFFGSDVTAISGDLGDPFPEGMLWNMRPSIISFLSPWIVPAKQLDGSALAINFHPASRNYPGIGCYNFALYENAEEYGATCHFMTEKVDTGAIIEERRFTVRPDETVESLKLRTMIVIIGLYHDVLSRLAANELPQPSGLKWSRRPFTRKELNALTETTPDMPANEIARRVRATTYPGYPGAKTVLGSVTSRADVAKRKPLA